ncbi:hypothetical protein OG225_40265 (plasmid) [Nocardia sp. NBC_01377]|uniref:hypothetical protein n=1 Tax=Nocardia sp. NBC_01377 TaxID=2903595 RepID=UPI002F9187F4
MTGLLQIKTESVRLGARPVGIRQQLSYLFVVAALREAFAALGAHRHVMAEASEQVRSARAAQAEARLARVRFDAAGEWVAHALGEAVLWSEHSPPAAEIVRDLTRHYREEHGLIIDVESGIVEVDPEFSSEVEQNRRLSMALDERQRRARTTAAAIVERYWPRLSEHVIGALWVPVGRARRDRLRAQLAERGIAELVCRTVVFVLAYLSGNTSDMSFLEEAPPLIDPGEEIKAALDSDLAQMSRPEQEWGFGGAPDWTERYPWWESATALLRTPDRARTDAARTAAIQQSVAVSALWPDHTDRAELGYLLTRYREQLDSLTTTAHHLVEQPATIDDAAWDWVQDQLTGLRDTRESLDAVSVQNRGLLEIEQIRLRQALHVCDLGDIYVDDAVFVGSLYQRGRDQKRLSQRGEDWAELSAALINDALLEAGKDHGDLALDFEGPDEYADLDEWSIMVRLSRIAHGDPDSEQSSHELVAAVDRIIADHAISEQATALVRGQLHGCLGWARAEGDHLQVCRTGWTERLSTVCAARDAGQLHFGLLAPEPIHLQSSPGIEVGDRDQRSIIGAAIPHEITRHSHLDPHASTEQAAQTRPGTEQGAQP